MEQLVRRELPRSMDFELTDMSYLEQLAGARGMEIFAYAVMMVFLMLAAQYESWSLPLAVILVVPMCLLSALAGVDAAHMDMNIFTQVGFVVLVGLASKNAILIVEFAKQQRQGGKPRRDATLEACQLRLRPIVMTSLAFILGVVPLIRAHGAGAEMRKALGTAVFSGMLGVTIFGVVLTPVFFYTIDGLGQSRVFSSRAVRLAGRIVLDCLRLGFIWRPLRAGARLFSREEQPSAIARANDNDFEQNGEPHEHRLVNDKVPLSKDN
jgi:multidrug efflux pump